MKRSCFYNDGYYHVYNRGVDKKFIFLDNADRNRFLCSLIEFNKDQRSTKYSPLSNEHYRPLKSPKPLVEICAFALMGNHFHLLLRQKTDKGVSKFMQRLLNGFTKYFNKRYERSGPLLSGPYKVKLIEDDAYLKYICAYIHLNPIKTLGIEENLKCSDSDDALQRLSEYKWSSLFEYMNDSDGIVHKRLFNELFQTPDQHLRFLKTYLNPQHPMLGA